LKLALLACLFAFRVFPYRQTGTYGIRLKDFGGWTTTTHSGTPSTNFAPVDVYYTEEGGSFEVHRSFLLRDDAHAIC